MWPSANKSQELCFLHKDFLALLPHLLKLSIRVVEEGAICDWRKGVTSKDHVQEVQWHSAFPHLLQLRQLQIESAFHVLQVRQDQEQTMTMVNRGGFYWEELSPKGRLLLDRHLWETTRCCQPVEVGMHRTLLNLTMLALEHQTVSVSDYMVTQNNRTWWWRQWSKGRAMLNAPQL